MIILEYEENFKVKVFEFKTFKEKDNWFKANSYIWGKVFAIYGKEEVLK